MDEDTWLPRPSPERVENLRRLAEAERRWAAERLDDIPFNPEGCREYSDYNLHYLHLEAAPEALDALSRAAGEISGLDPGTGRHLGRSADA